MGIRPQHSLYPLVHSHITSSQGARIMLLLWLKIPNCKCPWKQMQCDRSSLPHRDRWFSYIIDNIPNNNNTAEKLQFTIYLSICLSFFLSFLSIYLTFLSIDRSIDVKGRDCASLPSKVEVDMTKAKQLCETSSKNGMSQLQIEEILRSFFDFWHRQCQKTKQFCQNGKLSAELTAS